MNSDERKSWLMSIEDAVFRTESVGEINRVREVFTMFRANSLDDLPENSFEQVFSELMLLASS